ncbi:hypothetical protein AAG594_00640 [Citromicrobium bathyomarinum]
MEQIAKPPLDTIESITFFKRDELTTDLICCEINANGQTHLYHEEWEGWEDLIADLEGIDGFRRDWFSKVSQPPFSASRFLAFESRAE